MESAFSILMFIFSGALLLYAGLVAVFGVTLILRHWAAEIKDEKAYARRFAKILALTALAPALSGVVGLLVDMEQSPFLPLLTLLLGIIAAIWLGVRLTRRSNP